MKRHDIEECLEIIWHLLERHGEANISGFAQHDLGTFGVEVIRDLEKLEYITVNNEIIKMTAKGNSHARQVVRSHRLAERLLTDVLGMKLDEIESKACEFEHVLIPEIVDSICTLLGHPKLCPHGIKIPEGDCCKNHQDSIHSAVMSLAEGEIDETYKVAYINTNSDSRLQKLLNFQILPNSSIKILQRYPTFVIQGRNTQLALDKDIMKEIYVWKKASKANTTDTNIFLSYNNKDDHHHNR
ncbi:MAG: metal-dependent transcriptional regulator [Oligoflexia bacterium]|nr:metal-dependent transcriptional regulator [Oligoflexia bacterium]